VKPAKFEYLRPVNIAEAVQFLAEYGEEAKILSGGQSLIPVMNMRLSTPKYLIDIGQVPELNYIKEDDGRLCIGTVTRHVEVGKSLLVKEKCNLLHQAIHYVGHPQIRNRGTIGGSIAHADPSAELPCVLTALKGDIVIANADGDRVVEPEEFFLTYLLTSLEPTEMVKEVRFPVLSATCGSAFVELARRHGDFALVGVAAAIDLDENGKISFARLGVCGANPVPTSLSEIEESLIGLVPNEAVLKEAGEAVRDYISPEGDLHGSAEYREQLSSVLTFRALTEAASRAGKGVQQ
jgi:CO/xanthine dehydrogenase FAD-binding subunit